MPHTRRLTAAQRERRALVAAALARRVVEACSQSNRAVLDTVLALPDPVRAHPATLKGVAISRFATGRLVGLWLQADFLWLPTQLAVLPPLDLARTVVLAQVQWAGALLADERSPSPPRAPPRGPERQDSTARGVFP